MLERSREATRREDILSSAERTFKNTSTSNNSSRQVSKKFSRAVTNKLAKIVNASSQEGLIVTEPVLSNKSKNVLGSKLTENIGQNQA